MINPEILDFIDRFQTAIVGAVGFVGVIWTLRTNARQSRDEHQRQTDTRRKALRRILVAEFRNYSHALKRNVEAAHPTDDVISIGKIRKLFSEDLAADIGLLELAEVDIVVNALISLDGMAHILENLSVDQSDNRFLFPGAAWGDFRMVASTTADALEFAIEALERSGDA